ncbi:MAG: iron-sulfur cluster carrier protein ApbC [Pseudomonadota bacterium]|uniref:iron-sulfur cluster carrier protein ApbC n=1 Tax=Pseudohongiella sp. O18 TaxID=2904248 RepID=UPI000C5F8018|nr:iron-sulfur cluster carrier protein ApbC [Pseudohongiella sp. O18]MAY56808.1 iron-sulfur cluster carrier protein ApbC [Gammaproteobacteria bacterium]MBJ54652.1 iron-sulfur cluster carrier protein ApbC [Gammaproteobacteria bacterium]MEC8858779.1 iron-sulfur cluster carrier protein ApbC [Pseudomonadota bacterium]
MESLATIKHIICIASGKGGVGKSTTAVNLAVALHQQGYKTGLLDADIYGPSLPLMLGVPDGTRPQVKPGKIMLPLVAHGIETNSIGFLVDAKTAMVWRAPMIVGAFNQLLLNTQWSALDYLIIDLPPGTGDIQLSLTQTARVSGAVIVTTPQDVALSDARKGMEMFRKVRVPLLGVVENMSQHVCSNCGHIETIFGEGGGDRLAQDFDTPLIGSLPLDRLIRSQGDAGTPVTIAQPDGPIARAYHSLADALRDRLARQVEARPAAPTIDVTDD